MYRVLYRVNMIRWRLARWIAPAPVVAAPAGDAKAYIFIREANASMWIETSSINVDMGTTLRPLEGHNYGLATAYGPTGTFSGTIGEAA